MRDFQKEMKYYKASEQVGGLYASAPGERTFSRVKVPKSPGSGKA